MLMIYTPHPPPTIQRFDFNVPRIFFLLIYHAHNLPSNDTVFNRLCSRIAFFFFIIPHKRPTPFTCISIMNVRTLMFTSFFSSHHRVYLEVINANACFTLHTFRSSIHVPDFLSVSSNCLLFPTLNISVSSTLLQCCAIPMLIFCGPICLTRARISSRNIDKLCL